MFNSKLKKSISKLWVQVIDHRAEILKLSNELKQLENKIYSLTCEKDKIKNE